MWFGSLTANENTNVTQAPCPHLNCARIQFDFTIGNCGGTYKYKWRNQYEKEDGSGYYLYFHPRAFKWVCATSIELGNTCYSYTGDVT